MTVPYGVTQHGAVDHLIEDPGARAKEFENFFGACRWIAPLIFQAIDQVVVAAKQGQDFLSEVGRERAAEGLEVTWTTPAGFPVVQQYLDQRSSVIESRICGLKTKVRFSYDGDKLDKARQRRSLAPNFIHSLDAAHLVLTVNAMQDEVGPQSWAMVHDSFGTHAGQVQKLAEVLREQFVLMYQLTEPLADLREEAQVEVDLPPTGTFDLDHVLEADCFFA